jgi:hypothetical protein
MLTSLGAAALLGIIGTFAAVLWTVVLAFGGAPGSALAILGERRGSLNLIRAGTTLSFVIESYLLLAFAALVVRFVDAFLAALDRGVVSRHRACAVRWAESTGDGCPRCGRDGLHLRAAGGGLRVLGVRRLAAGAGVGLGVDSAAQVLGRSARLRGGS